VEFSLALARGSTVASDGEALALIAGDSGAVVLDSTVAEAGSLNTVGVASLAEAVLDGDSPAAARDVDSLAAVLDGDPAEVSEEAPWAAGSTAVVDAGNCRTLLD
jgi:hypothetical protein